MNNSKIKKAFDNRAKMQHSERIACDKCFEQIIYHLRDSEGHDFSVGLSTVMECLMFAIQKGNLPKLPLSWISDADFVCNSAYSENEKLWYSDYNFPRKQE